MDITVQYEIRQVQQVHEKKMSYDLHMLLFVTWTDKRLIGLTDKTGCSPLFVHEGDKLWVPGKINKQSLKPQKIIICINFSYLYQF